MKALLGDYPVTAALKQGRLRPERISLEVKNSVSRADADEVSRLLGASIEAAGSPDMNPYGVEANRRNLEVAIETVARQQLIPRRYSVDELYA